MRVEEGNIYVVGDLHGCLDEWLELKDRIEASDAEAKFILVGDIVDRGPKQLELYDWVMKNITEDGKYQMILGNHDVDKEAMIAECLNNDGDINTIIRYDNYNFISTVSERYKFYTDEWEKEEQNKKMKEILEFYSKLRLVKRVLVKTGEKEQLYTIVHGGIPSTMINPDGTIRLTNITLDEKQALIWDRNYTGYNKIDSIVVHGHTPTIVGDAIMRGAYPGLAWFNRNDINVDCGISYKQYSNQSNLLVIRLNDLKEFYLYDKDIDKKSLQYEIYESNKERLLKQIGR